jgi:hypothetical protein
MLIKLLVTIFILFAASRVWLRWRDGSVSIFSAAAWSMLWLGVVLFSWFPKLSDSVAHVLGIGRGVDAFVYIGVLFLLYGFFRLYIKVEFIEHEMTGLTRAITLKEKNERPN